MVSKTKMLAETIDNEFIRCTACVRYCKIKDGQAGFCGVRTNNNGKLELIVYSKPAAIWLDPVEKKPLYHFLPGTKIYSLGTLGCNFGCEFCQNWDISQAPAEYRARDPVKWRDYFSSLLDRCETMSPEQVVENAVASNAKSIAFTYNEPTIFTEYAIDIMKLAGKKGLKGVYVTNGYESKECWDAMKGYIDAVNIDLKAFNNRFYGRLCKALNGYQPVLDSIKYAKKLGFWVEVTTLFIPDENDNPGEMKQAAEFLASVDREMPWHVTAFHPDYKMLDKDATPPETLVRAREIGKEAGLKHVYCGNVPLAYSNYESTICQSCGKEVINRSGFRVIENNIIEGKCRFCKSAIKGVWD